MAEKIFNRADVILQLFREGECCSNQSRYPLPQGTVEAFNVMGSARQFSHHPMLIRRNYTRVRGIAIRPKHDVLPIDQWQFLPQLSRTLFTAVADMKSERLTDLAIDG